MSSFPQIVGDGIVVALVLFMALIAVMALTEIGARVRRQRLLGGSAIPKDQLPLSPGERKALIEVARGHSHKIAAERLGLAPRTVSNQVSTVYLKKGVNNITSAVVLCLRDGDISLSDILPPDTHGAQGEPATGRGDTHMKQGSSE